MIISNFEKKRRMKLLSLFGIIAQAAIIKPKIVRKSDVFIYIIGLYHLFYQIIFDFALKKNDFFLESFSQSSS